MRGHAPGRRRSGHRSSAGAPAAPIRMNPGLRRRTSGSPSEARRIPGNIAAPHQSQRRLRNGQRHAHAVRADARAHTARRAAGEPRRPSSSPRTLPTSTSSPRSAAPRSTSRWHRGPTHGPLGVIGLGLVTAGAGVGSETVHPGPTAERLQADKGRAESARGCRCAVRHASDRVDRWRACTHSDGSADVVRHASAEPVQLAMVRDRPDADHRRLSVIVLAAGLVLGSSVAPTMAQTMRRDRARADGGQLRHPRASAHQQALAMASRRYGPDACRRRASRRPHSDRCSTRGRRTGAADRPAAASSIRPPSRSFAVAVRVAGHRADCRTRTTLRDQRADADCGARIPQSSVTPQLRGTRRSHRAAHRTQVLLGFSRFPVARVVRRAVGRDDGPVHRPALHHGLDNRSFRRADRRCSRRPSRFGPRQRDPRGATRTVTGNAMQIANCRLSLDPHRPINLQSAICNQQFMIRLARTCRWPAACRARSSARSSIGARRFRSSARTPTSGAAASVPAAEIREFRAKVKAAGLHPVVSHASYLINLATTDPPLRRQSLDAMADEIDRAEALGLLGVVLHPGCYTRAAKPTGLDLDRRRPARAARRAPPRQDDGHAGAHRRPGHVARRDVRTARVHHREDERITAASASAWTPATCWRRATTSRRRKAMRARSTQFERLVGVERLKVFHLNDSKRPLGSRVDRHEHIGQGCVGLEPFRRLVNDRRFRRAADAARNAEGGGPLADADRDRSASTSGTSTSCAGLIVERTRTRRSRRSSRSDSSLRVPQLSSCPGLTLSPNTSASNRHTFAPCFHASRGRPALWQVCARNVSRSQRHSVATCGSSSPRCQPCSTTRPWRPTSMSSGDVDRLERPEQRHLDLEAGQLRGGDRREARIGAAGRDRALADDARRAAGSPRCARCSRAARRRW